MPTTRILIVAAIAVTAAAWGCDVIASLNSPTLVNGLIGYFITAILALAMLELLLDLPTAASSLIRVSKLLLAVLAGLWIAPPIMDIPPDMEWNIPLGAIQYLLLVASFIVAFGIHQIGRSGSRPRAPTILSRS